MFVHEERILMRRQNNMKKAVIEIDNNQLVRALEQLPHDEIKKVIDALFLKGLYKKTRL